jgi:hypothetical protein
MDADPFMLANLYTQAPAAVKADLHAQLMAQFLCRGSADAQGTCN